ncbi:MAG: hypothetical protein WA885_12995 [Phormidesmis sp.]
MRDTKIRVIVLKQSRKKLIQDFKDLLEETQKLPQVQGITEEDIAAEIEAYRAGQ